MLSERRNHIPFNLSEVCVFHVFYFLAGANFMIIAPYCFYVQRCRTSYLNPRTIKSSLLGSLSLDV
ncbi:hypothetical protein DYL72_18520 [Vibrio anguillarum]|uniref:DUF3265 domain-containing protein n=1 Tax=Vibrio anguillarum TaxID=55601 RepID=A0A7U5NCZ5_VIBAN|nr:hypothetical protein CK207_17045 [Vibrio anguillarum]AZS26950.1 hypothetical protein DYL72_18520 [Vibrio anguillarum]